MTKQHTPTGQLTDFGKTAATLSRNPLGIIALCLVLTYGFASLVIVGNSLSTQERVPMIDFLVGFPVLVLLVFAWLVSKHSPQLFAPADFRNEDNYVRMQLSAAASLAVAAAKHGPETMSSDVQDIVQVVRSSALPRALHTDGWGNHILWVDDKPENNVYERRAFEALGLTFTLALSTQEALKQLSNRRFAAIISDMGRREGANEGYVLLDALRKRRDPTPFFVYAGSNSPEHKRETIGHGGQGCANNAQELFQMVMKAVITQS